MPKIQLSALASDMKGKSGGSVFSTNQGGTYFRNNPSGGGKKSDRWDLNKSQFSYVSGLWRNLSEQQQTAWNDATSNFPTTNAFGAPRIPSGYELFMRLNATLHSINRPVLLLPPSPESFPDIVMLDYSIPDAFNFVPGVASVVGAPFSEDSLSYIKVNKIDFDTNPADGLAYFFKFRLLKEFRRANDPNPVYNLFSVGDPSADHFNISFFQTLFNRGRLIVSLTAGRDSYQIVYDIDNNLSSNFHTLSFFTGKLNFNEIEIRLDNLVLTPVSTEGKSYLGITFSDLISFGAENDLTASPFAVVDFRAFSDNCSGDTWSKICNGYEAPASNLWFGFNEWSDLKEKSSGTLLTDAEAVYSSIVASPFYLIKTGFTFCPSIFFELASDASEEYVLAIYSTPSLSPGKRSQQSRRRRIAVIPFVNSFEFQTTEGWRDSFGGASDGGHIQLFADVINPRTGQSTSRKPKPKPKNPTRFKSGAELNGKV